MKKIILTAAIAIMTVGISSAQWFVGGNVSFGTEGSETTTAGNPVKGPTTTAYGINPYVGYNLDENWVLGLGAGFGSVSEKTFAPDATTTSSRFEVWPFARYNFVNMGGFTIGAEARLSAGFAPDNDETNLGAAVLPVVTFGVSKHFTLVTHLNVFSLGYYNNTVKADSNNKTVQSGFAFGVDGDNVFNLGALTFGVVYNF